MAGTNELWIVLAGHGISALLMLVVGSFVLARGPRRVENRLFFFLTASTFAYELFFIIAAMQSSYAAAYFWWSFNIVDVFITMSVVHFILRIAGRDTAWRWFIALTYACGFALIAATLLLPHAYLPAVVPKLYFPYYLDGGWLYQVFLAYFLLFPLPAAATLIGAYRRSSGIERKRLEYFILMLVVGYGIGSTNFLLVFNIPVDPIIGVFLGFYLLPIAYGIFATDLLDIRIAVRRALYYALAVAAVTAFLVALTFLNPLLIAAIPGLSVWVLPLIVAFLSLLVGRLVLSQLQESDRLKYEFVTVATHKLRTPLTRIRWTLADLLERSAADPAMHEGLLRIDDANNRLIELTNGLIEVAHSGEAVAVARAPLALAPLVTDALGRYGAQIAEKHISVSQDVAATYQVLGASAHILSVIEVFLENAIQYTPQGGTIAIAAAPDERGVRLSITDSGIGVAPEDRSHIFAGFFRADAAKTADTEGMGLGLSLAKNIIERLGGTIGFDSAGTNQGSTFWFTLPAA